MASNVMRLHQGLMTLLLCAAAALGLQAMAAASASAATTWLCAPGMTDDPCGGSLATTEFSATGADLGVVQPRVVREPKVDCFYVYATVSDQTTLNANLVPQPVEDSVAQYQVARYSQYCRIFAPMYPQVTVGGLQAPTPQVTRAANTAYAGVLAAWRDYITHDNHGRGFILIGHSQGAAHLIRLIRQEIDNNPSVRRRLISAVLEGGNVLVRRGSDIGGDFRHIPGCRRQTETGCVIAFSTFDTPPPSNAVFGLVDSPITELSDSPTTGPYQVLCTNPASLSGGAGPISPLFSTTPFAPGSIATAIELLHFSAPSAPTPWVQMRNAYEAQCSDATGANVLQITPLGTSPTPSPSPYASWGLHLLDPNIALTNVLGVVRNQIDAYLAAHP